MTALSGPEARPFVAELARLRIGVFRAFPYLYDGTPEYEETYLQAYLNNENAVVILARDGQAVIAAFSKTQQSCLACHQSFRQSFVEQFYGSR